MLRELPRRAQALILLVTALAAASATLSGLHVIADPPDATKIWRAIALAGAGVVYGELRIRAHALHRLGADARIHSNTVSFWLVVAAATTTPTLTLLVCAAVFAQQVTRACLSGTAVPHRVLYVGSVVSLTLASSSQAAHALSPGGSSALETVLLAAAIAGAYLLIPLVAVAAVMVLAGDRSDAIRIVDAVRVRWPKPEEWRSEIGLVTAGLLGGELIDATPWLTAAGIGVLTAVHLLGERRSVAQGMPTTATAVDPNPHGAQGDHEAVIGNRHLAAVPPIPRDTSGLTTGSTSAGSTRRHWSTLDVAASSVPTPTPRARAGVMGRPAMMTLADLRASATRRRELAAEQGWTGRSRRTGRPSSTQ